MRREFAILYMEKRKYCCNYIMTTLQNLEEIGSQHTALTKPLQNPQLRWDNCTLLGRALKIITSSNNTKKIKKHHLQQQQKPTNYLKYQTAN